MNTLRGTGVAQEARPDTRGGSRTRRGIRTLPLPGGPYRPIIMPCPPIIC